MEALLSLPYELQITLVSGYFGYKISSIGKGRAHRTEDFLLQVLSFGLLARASVALGLWARPLPAAIPEAGIIACIAVATVLFGLIFGMFWRSYGESWMRLAMNCLGIYRDDHEASVWQSIMNRRGGWTVLQIYLENGVVLEANFSRMRPYPKVPVVINDDGVGVYLTGRYKDDGTYEEWEITGNDGDLTFTFIPRAEIKRMDVNWRLPSSDIIASEALPTIPTRSSQVAPTPSSESTR